MGTRGRGALLAAIAGLGLTACGGGAASSAHAAAVSLVSVGSFDQPTYVTGALGDATRLYVVQRAGLIKVLSGGEQKTFADLTPYVSGTDGERGLLSIALAPDFGSSHRFYAYYTAKGTNAVTIARFTATSADSAAGATPEVLISIPHDQQSNHNGGQLQFGPDGMLYAGTGDGGAGGDPSGNGQYLSGPVTTASGVNHDPRLAKLLRIDVSGASGDTAPPSNAFGPAGKPAEVWAYGLRNPYRFSFDGTTGDLVIGDVGQDHIEEVDFLAAGAAAGTNFGWSGWEGTRVQNGSPSRDGVTFPVLEYGHQASDDSDNPFTGCSVIGGYVVRDPNLPELAGQYLYSDYCSSSIRAAQLSAGGATNDHDLGLPGQQSIVSFGEDGCGRVYVVTQEGTVQRFSTTGACTLRAAPAGVPILGGGVPAGGTAPGTADTVAPKVSLLSRKAQRVARTGQLTLSLRCDEICQLTSTGTFTVARRAKGAKALRLRTRHDTLDAGARITLKLSFAKSTRRTLAAALRRHRKVSARIVLATADAAGNKRTTVVSVPIRR